MSITGVTPQYGSDASIDALSAFTGMAGVTLQDVDDMYNACCDAFVENGVVVKSDVWKRVGWHSRRRTGFNTLFAIVEAEGVFPVRSKR